MSLQAIIAKSSSSKSRAKMNMSNQSCLRMLQLILAEIKVRSEVGKQVFKPSRPKGYINLAPRKLAVR